MEAGQEGGSGGWKQQEESRSEAVRSGEEQQQQVSCLLGWAERAGRRHGALAARPLATRVTRALERNGQVHISTACTSERLSQRWLGPGPELKGLMPLQSGEEGGRAVGLGQAGAWQ